MEGTIYGTPRGTYVGEVEANGSPPDHLMTDSPSPSSSPPRHNEGVILTRLRLTPRVAVHVNCDDSSQLNGKNMEKYVPNQQPVINFPFEFQLG